MQKRLESPFFCSLIILYYTPSGHKEKYMLILSEGVGEKIIINPGEDNETEIVILGVKGGQYKLGFNAPKHVTILREKVISRALDMELKDYLQLAAAAG